MPDSAPSGSDRFDELRRQIRERAQADPEGTYRLAGYAGDLKRVGRHLTGLCCFHAENDPSFKVDVDGEYAGRWRCWGACRDGGDVIQFVARTECVSRGRATMILAERLDLELPQRRAPQPSSSPVKGLRGREPSPEIVDQLAADLWANPEWLAILREQRGLSDETIREARLGLWEDRLAIPVLDRDGSTVLDIRLYSPGAKEQAKMVGWRRGTGSTRLYVPPGFEAPRPDETLCVVEGEMDCLLLADLGFRALTNTNGAAAWPEDGEAELDLSGVRVVTLGDHDDAGRERNAAIAEWAHAHGAVEVGAVTWPEGKQKGFDVTDFLGEVGVVADRAEAGIAFAELLGKAEPIPHASGDGEVMEWTAATELREKVARVSWLWQDWLPRGFITILAAAAGDGKSGIALDLASRRIQGLPWPDQVADEDADDTTTTAATGAPVLVIDAEGCQAIWCARIEDWKVPSDSILFPGDGFARVPLDDLRVLEGIRQTIRERQVSLVVIDSLRSALPGSIDENDSSVGSLLAPWCDLARDENVALLIVHHFGKPKRGESHLATLDRLRGSTAIAAAARVVMAVDRPQEEPRDEDPTMRLSVVKSNLAALPPPIGFYINEEGVNWCEAPTPPKKEKAADRAGDFLQTFLHGEAQPLGEIKVAGTAAGVTNRALYQAKKLLRIVEIPDPDPRRRRKWWGLPQG